MKLQEKYKVIGLINCKQFLWKKILFKAQNYLKETLYGRVIKDEKNYKEFESLKKLIKSKSNLEDCLLSLGHIMRVWLLMPKYAMTFYEQIIAFNPSDPTPYFFLGFTYRSEGEVDKAIEMYKTALKIKFNYPDCLFNLGNIYFEHYDDLVNAEECYRNALTFLLPATGHSRSIITKGRVCNLLGELQIKKGNVSKAVEYYLEGIAEDNEYIENYTDFAEIIQNYGLPEFAYILKYIINLLSYQDIIEKEDDKDYIDNCIKVLQNRFEENGYPNDVKNIIKRIYKSLNDLLIKDCYNKSNADELKITMSKFSFISNT